MLAALPALALVTVSAQSGCQYVEHVDQAGFTRRLRVAENRTPNTRDCVDGIVLIDEADNKGMFINYATTTIFGCESSPISRNVRSLVS